MTRSHRAVGATVGEKVRDKVGRQRGGTKARVGDTVGDKGR